MASTPTMIAVTSLEILMNTSLSGFVLGIRALRYALPMSRVMMVLFSAAAICARRKIEVREMVGDEVSAAEYSPLSWQSPPPTSRALTLSLTRPAPSVVGKYFCVTFSCERMIPFLCASVSVEVRTGLKTPLSIKK